MKVSTRYQLKFKNHSKNQKKVRNFSNITPLKWTCEESDKEGITWGERERGRERVKKKEIK